MLNIINALNNNQLICFPTETVYALACNAQSIKAIDQIYKIKKRDKNKPLSIFISNIQQLNEIVVIRKDYISLIQYFVPGPITFIIPLKDNNKLPKEFFHDTIGVRIPDHPIALAILNEFKSPIVATSINSSGEKSVSKACDISNDMKKNISVIIKNDELVIGVESTIIDLTTDEIAILRKGAVADESIKDALFRLKLSNLKQI